MKILIGIVALVAISAAATRLQHVDCFRFYFASMKQADASINPVQRAFISLVLTESFHPEKRTGQNGHATPPRKPA